MSKISPNKTSRNSPDKSTAQQVELDALQVADYLHQHPDFFIQNDALLSSLNIPHESGTATSLVERQLKILRQQNRQLDDKLTKLIEVARDNETLSKIFNQLAMELMTVDQLHDVLSLTQNFIQTHFDTDYVCFKFLPDVEHRLQGLDQHYIDQKAECFSQLKSWINSRTPVCGEVPKSVSRVLFGQQVELGSCALVPLYHTEELGLLCLGSRDQKRFNAEMGTLFLQQLGELMSTRFVNLHQ